MFDLQKKNGNLGRKKLIPLELLMKRLFVLLDENILRAGGQSLEVGSVKEYFCTILSLLKEDYNYSALAFEQL